MLRVASAGAVGLGLGFAAGRSLRTANNYSIVGTYRLETMTKTDGPPDSDGISGLLVYEPDGCMSSYLVKNSTYLGFSGRWWQHNASTSYAATYPPHDGLLVEHEVTAASNPGLVGKNQVWRYALSPDGQQLTTSIMELRDGKSTAIRTSEWRRVSE